MWRHVDASTASRRSTTSPSSSRSQAPNVYFVRTIADSPSAILPKHVLAGQTRDQVNKGDFKHKSPIGTGPFKLKEIVPDQFISFEANPNYYDGRPNVDTVIYKAITSETAPAQLQSGELDIALNVGATNFDRLSAREHPGRAA